MKQNLKGKNHFIYLVTIDTRKAFDVANHVILKKIQVGKNQEKAQSEKDSHSKNRGGKKPN